MNKLVLMEGETFVVSGQSGDIGEDDPAEGLYYRDTRYLSQFCLLLNGCPLIPLSASGERTYTATVQLTNPPFELDDGTPILPQTIGVRRSRYVLGSMQERIELRSFNGMSIPYELKIVCGADFRDMFDVRGYVPQVKRGRIDPPVQYSDRIEFSYSGLDGVQRFLELHVNPSLDAVELELPTELEGVARPAASLPDASVSITEYVPQPVIARISLRGQLQPNVPVVYTIRFQPREGDFARGELYFDEGIHLLRRSYERWERQETASIQTSNSLFDRLLTRSKLDLRVLTQRLPSGPVPVAGIPWFATIFGRDSLITALETLMLDPALARGTLRYLAAHQGTRVDDWRDEEPGKILHEIRQGELARSGQVPHTPYYGSIDSTPLFLILAAETLRWTDDQELFAELRSSILAALQWIDRYGDIDGDGYLEYQSRSKEGIRNQVWKDSHDSLQHADGMMVEPPIAGVEVQAYVYAAKRLIAEVFETAGETQLAHSLKEQAEQLRQRFNRDFWLAELPGFAQALDPTKQPVRVATSNMGHVLFGGIADPDYARQAASRLFDPDLNSGWGIRTLSSHVPSFNPMSYHNGSIWPHDNAILVQGLRTYGLDSLAVDLASQIYQAALSFEYMRLPELYCGFPRDQRLEGTPVSYPVSCSPQAWAAGAPILILQSLLGLRPASRCQRLYLRPALPDWLDWVQLSNLRIGPHRVSLRIERGGPRYRLDVLQGGEDVHVILEH